MANLTTSKILFPTAELSNPGDLTRIYNQAPVLTPNAEPCAALDVFHLARARLRVMQPNIEKVHPMLIFSVVPAQVGHRPGCFHHDGGSVELCVARVKYVS
jgi:hypothetical protein